MSSAMWWYIVELVASFSEGAGLNPDTDPRPVVKQTMLQPPATCPVIEQGSYPGESMNVKPFAVIGSAYL